MSLSDYLLIAGVACLIAAAVTIIIKQKKKGRCISCSSCPYNDNCEKKKN